MKIRTRFAPSPTGYLHIGGLRTALYAFLFAKKSTGAFVLRIEDTDRERYVPGAVEAMIKTLDRMGLPRDEGPALDGEEVVQKGDFGPYIQSMRTEIYKEHVQILLDKGAAYKCFCSPDRLSSVRKQQELAKLPTKYDRTCLKLSQDEIDAKLSANEPYVIRLKIPEGKTIFEDEIRGTITINNDEVDDQVLMKSDGFPTYHLAVVVDDHLMEISHIIRGEEWLSSVPKHIILYDAFGWDKPKMAHLPLLLNPDKSKLSKRQGDVSVEDFLDKGYLEEALINFVALLGFNPKGDQEIYSISELEQLFDLKKVNKGGAVFNREKLDWMNGQYIHQKTSDELAELVKPFLNRADKTVDEILLKKVCEIEKDRLVTLAEIVEKIDMYQGLSKYNPVTLVWKKSDEKDALNQLENAHKFIESMNDDYFSSIELVEKQIKGYIEDNGLQNGNVLWPLRVSLSGQAKSPSPFELIWALGKAETLMRINHAVKLLES